MRVGLLIYGSLEGLSGGYLYDRKLVEFLKEQGDQVEIVSLSWRDYARHLTDNFSSSFFKRLSALKLDVLLQDELNHPSLFLINRRLRKVASYRLITIVHHLHCNERRPAWQNWLYRQPERSFLASLDGYVLNSQSTLRSVETALGRGLSKPWVVAQPAGDRFAVLPTESEIAQRAAQPGPLRLLFLGNLIPRKGLHVLLEALSRLPANAWSLSVAGSADFDPAYARRIHSQVGQRGLTKNVRFLGALKDGELAALLAESQVLTLPSSYEGFGIVYLEGMGFGLPAIAGSLGGAGEIITHDQDGYLVEPEDVEALAGYIADLAGDRQKLLALSLAARRRFLQHPTWEQTCRRLRDFLLEQI